MKATLFFFFLVLFFIGACKQTEPEFLTKTHWGKNKKTNTYINLYKELAYNEMRRTKIPASIKMAQAILESDRGQSELARNKNNHFGIKCRKKHCDGKYARYKTVEQCWRDHSKLLTSDRYQKLFLGPPKTYKEWAIGLQSAGYARDKRYAYKLIEMIEDYQLYLLDE